ncbi:MAG: hypothetical protein J0H66_03860 [Solirubrobacterales bacterium]|nr:hypothetical protein [Solirubrobacterales bacterium]OJU96227.1 MAG: hypothetical protein BGO23_01525 [Solirubrobacterales bacterium 67-14]
MSRPKGVSAVLVLLCLGLFAYGCGGDDDGATQEQLDKAKAEGAKEAREQAKLDQLQNQIKQLQKKTNNGSRKNSRSNGNSGRGDGYYENGSSSGGPVSSCATGVEVGPNTSCAFAMNVAGEYGSNPGASTIHAYSPVTGDYYTMSCGPWNGGTVCTGGNGAAVYMP